MFSLMLFFRLMAVNTNPDMNCETYGPRLDGTRVTVCVEFLSKEGRVTKVEDGFGNVRKTKWAAR